MPFRPRIGKRAGRLLDGVLERSGLRLNRILPPTGNDADHLDTLAAVRPYTMTSPARIQALCDAVQYVTRHGIPGAIVECGVWRGGSMMAVARTLLKAGVHDRDLYLFDTFEGMTPPGPEDEDVHGRTAHQRLASSGDHEPIWARAPLEGVRVALRGTGYPEARIHYVQGKVEDTVPAQAPGEIAILRLDTDWYGSTKHEWDHLWPRVVKGGVVIVDDYGHWQGARKATDEFLATSKARLLLHRVDSEARIGVKIE